MTIMVTMTMITAKQRRRIMMIPLMMKIKKK